MFGHIEAVKYILGLQDVEMNFRSKILNSVLVNEIFYFYLKMVFIFFFFFSHLTPLEISLNDEVRKIIQAKLDEKSIIDNNLSKLNASNSQEIEVDSLQKLDENS